MPEVEAPTNENQEREVQLDPEQQLEWGNIVAEQQAAKEEKAKDDENTDGKTDESEVTDGEAENEEEENDDEKTEEAKSVETETLPDDPGEFTPGDYSFDVTLDGKVTKLSTPEEVEKFADDNIDKLDAKQIFQILKLGSKMEAGLEKDKADYEAKKQAFEDAKAIVETERETVETLASEITYLVSKGLLPQASKKYLNANWNDPEVAKQPGVKEQLELIAYMNKENELRLKSKLKPITSAIDAYNAWQLEKTKETAKEEEETKGQARRNASARVAGSSPNPVNIAPKGISVGRALNLDDLDSL